MDGCAGFASNGLTHGDRRSPQGRQNANYFDRSTYNCGFWWISNGTRHWLLRWRGARANSADRYHPVAIASDLSRRQDRKLAGICMGTHRPMRFLPFSLLKPRVNCWSASTLPTARKRWISVSTQGRSSPLIHPEYGSQTVYHLGRMLCAEINYQKLRDNSGRWTDCHR